MKILDHYNKRSFHHDYFQPFIYHIIFKKTPHAKEFGYLRGNPNIPPTAPGTAYIFLSPLGESIFKGFDLFLKRYSIFQKYRHCIMPDHIHMILYKKTRDTCHLDWYMERLKECMLEDINSKAETPIEKNVIFTEGYTDKPLYDRVNLNTWFTYLKENPYRRLTIKLYPDYFRRKRSLKIGGYNIEIYGNVFLLDNPDKIAVRIRRRFSPQEKLMHKSKFLEMSAKGTILISPFISDYEKQIRREAEKNGARIILIRHKKFGEKYKPAKHDFDLCSEGRLLIISLEMDTPLSYAIATQMNELAEYIATTFDTRRHSI